MLCRLNSWDFRIFSEVLRDYQMFLNGAGIMYLSEMIFFSKNKNQNTNPRSLLPYFGSKAKQSRDLEVSCSSSRHEAILLRRVVVVCNVEK